MSCATWPCCTVCTQRILTQQRRADHWNQTGGIEAVVSVRGSVTVGQSEVLPWVCLPFPPTPPVPSFQAQAPVLTAAPPSLPPPYPRPQYSRGLVVGSGGARRLHVDEPVAAEGVLGPRRGRRRRVRRARPVQLVVVPHLLDPAPPVLQRHHFRSAAKPLPVSSETTSGQKRRNFRSAASSTGIRAAEGATRASICEG